MDGARFWDWCDQFKRRGILVYPLLAVNLVAIVFGYYYYFQVGQFDNASQYFQEYGWWPFIPDSPNAVVLMSASLVLYQFGGHRSRLLDALAFTSMTYVGLWTTALFLTYSSEMATFEWSRFPANANPLLFLTHLGMPLEALILAKDMRKDALGWGLAGLVVAWQLLNLWLDYGPVHLHPAPFLPPHPALHIESYFLMAATLLAWLIIVRHTLGKNAAAATQG